MPRGPEHLARDWLIMGIRCLQTHKFEKAEECFRKAIAFKDDISDTWWQLGLALKALGRTTEAEDAFKKANVLDPLHGEREWKKDSEIESILDNEVFKETGKRMKLKEINIKENRGYSLNILGQSYGDSTLCTLSIFLNAKKVESHSVRRKFNVSIPLGILTKGAYRLGIILDTNTGYWELDASLEPTMKSSNIEKGEENEISPLEKGYVPFQMTHNHILQLQLDARALLLSEYETLEKKEQIILKIRRSKGQEDFKETRHMHPLNSENPSDWFHEALFGYLYFDDPETSKYLLSTNEIDPDNPAVLGMLSSLYFENRQYKEIIDLLEKSINPEDEEPELWAMLGLAYAWKRSISKSQKAMNIAREFAPRDGLILLCSSLQHYKSKNPEGAIEDLRKGAYFKLDWPRYAEYPGNFILMRFVIKQLDLLLKKRITSGLAQTIESTTRNRILTLIKKEFDEALISDTPAEPELDLDHPAETWYDYGCACALRGDLNAAEDALRKTTEMEPEWGEAWARYSRILMRMCRYIEGLKAMKKAKDLGFVET
ncbi:MAG: hypothetical protein KAR33_00895 [Candidatus Thorarchaeota archaeon]|nr:hypothetical protein [Candidatus Thorarchaeota archaeon]